MRKDKFDANKLKAVEKYYREELLGACHLCQEHSWKMKTDHHKSFITFVCMSCGHTEFIESKIAMKQVSSARIIKCRTCKQKVPQNNLSESHDEPACNGCSTREKSYLFGVLFNRELVKKGMKYEVLDLFYEANLVGISNSQLKEMAVISDTPGHFAEAILEFIGLEYTCSGLNAYDLIDIIRKAVPPVDQQ